MKRIFFLIFFIFLGTVFFPLKGLAVGTYTACPRDYPVYQKSISGALNVPECCCTKLEAETAKKKRLTSCLPISTIICPIERTRVTISYEGLVPCGLDKTIWEETISGNKTENEKGISCQFCHFLVMMNGIISFVLISIVPYVAVLMLIIGGGMFFFAGGIPSLLTRGQSLIKNVIIGLFLIYGSYILVGLFLSVMNVTNVNLQNWAKHGAFSINCMIK